MKPTLTGKTALITGAAGSIGSAIAERFAAEGARLILVDRDTDALDPLCARLGDDQTVAVACDIRSETQVTGLKKIIERLGSQLDILVNNAAVREYTALAETDAASWQRILAVNVIGTSLMTAMAMPWLRASGQGAIVNVASTFGICGRAGMGQYDATKSAMVAATRVLAIEEAKHGVRANVVCPGSVLTSFTLGRAEARGMSATEVKERGFLPAPIARWAEPAEIAAPVLWLASDEASFITGAVLAVDGGLSAQAVRL